MWERNIIEGSFSNRKRDFILKKSKKSQVLYASNENGDFELEKIGKKHFFLKHHRAAILLLAGLFLIETFIYYYSFILIAVLFELLLHKIKPKLCNKHIPIIYNTLRGFMILEVITVGIIYFLNPIYALIFPNVISALVIFNFYLFVRLYLLVKEIEFYEVYQLKEHHGFYVWRSRC